jgi:hypothetical protein
VNISIYSIRVNSISTIGSLNIGKTIIAHNRASVVQHVVKGSNDQLPKDLLLETMDAVEAATNGCLVANSSSSGETTTKSEVGDIGTPF